MAIRKSRLASNSAGALCATAAILSAGASFGIPGLGWVAAVLVLMLTGALAPVIPRRYSVAGFAIAVAHLLTLGPLSLMGQNGFAALPRSFLLIYVVAPFFVALIPILVVSFNANRRGKGTHPKTKQMRS